MTDEPLPPHRQPPDASEPKYLVGPNEYMGREEVRRRVHKIGDVNLAMQNRKREAAKKKRRGKSR